MERVNVSPVTYERVRADPTSFILSPGHGVAAVEEMVERGDGFLIARNLGRAAEMARAADPRRFVHVSRGAHRLVFVRPEPQSSRPAEPRPWRSHTSNASFATTPHPDLVVASRSAVPEQREQHRCAGQKRSERGECSADLDLLPLSYDVSRKVGEHLVELACILRL